MVEHKILLCDFMSRSCISGLSVVFQSVYQRQDTADQGNIQRSAVNMINEAGDGTELEGRFKRRDNFIQKHEEDEEFQDCIKFSWFRRAQVFLAVLLRFAKNKWEAHLNKCMEMLFSSECVVKLWDLLLLHRIEENSFGAIAKKKRGGGGKGKKDQKTKPEANEKRRTNSLSCPPVP